MKKTSLLLVLLLMLGITTTKASTKTLYSQPFETVTQPSEAGWSCSDGTLSIASDEYGNFLQFSLGQRNGRSAYGKWGSEIYGETAPTQYTMVFDFCVATAPNNQYSSNICVFTDQTPKDNTNYGSTYPNYVFDLTMTTDATTWYINQDATNTITLSAGTWYTVTLNVNTQTRAVDYSMMSITGESIATGSRIVPDSVSIYAEGLFNLASRYNSVFQFDNIKITTEVDGDYANDPVVSLTRLGQDADGNLSLNTRAYTITFGEGEDLHITGTDGTEIEVRYSDCDGTYTYETTTSGTFKAWTTYGSATSTVIETTADCSPCVLPAPTLSISSVVAGYGKTYTVTIDNSSTPLSPQIFFTYTFTDESGNTTAESAEMTTGSKITVDSKGTITLTTKAFGYQSTTTTVVNDIEYELKEIQDFARMAAADLTAKGYTKYDDLNSSATSGENNWTARKRLYYYDAATATTGEDGTVSYTAVYPFGYVDETGDYCIHRYQAVPESTLSEEATTFGSVTLWNNRTIQWLQGIGMMQNETTANTNTVTISNLASTDVVVVNTIDNYGSDSNHPVCNTADEYYSQLVGTDDTYTATADGTLDATTGTYSIAYGLYRIQTALVYVKIFSVKGTTGIQNVAAEKIAEDENAPYYTIGGMKVSKPTQRGIYIHNGKKYVVK